MKLVLFLGLILICMIASVLLAYVWMKKTNKFWLTFIFVVILNAIILGLGSLWWFLTEIDGVSQGLGVIFYGIAFLIINLIDLMVLYAINGKGNQAY
ncbi:hypothetical protein [Paucisalibacillus sp. EB02]|uniref:hypothetical protein n=1 Tax=Paucisalibacillus sp. EB02 TaxID=1347087 RepID=UPI0004B753D0|nr:hypothetical protein [Paucisalibacillus sp. EB02]